jgi:2-dehydro-3-deoxygluconokinase
MHKDFDVCALGEAMVEFNQTMPGEPLYRQGFGGDTSNAAVAAARAGARVAYLTRLGDDHFGQMLQGLWQREGVDTAAIQIDTLAPTGIYFVSHGAQGHAFSYLRAGSAASRMTPGWLHARAEGGPSAAERIARSRWLHVSGISLAISVSACDTVLEAMHLARQAGTRVALDSNLRLRLWPLDRARACLREAIGLCDLFLPSLEDLQTLVGVNGPSDIQDWCRAQRSPCTVLKLGAGGVMLDDGRTHPTTLPAHAVQAVDATGAGDCFAGNLLARLCAGDPLDQAAAYANAAAALSVQGFGAVDPLPRSADVQALLAAAA